MNIALRLQSLLESSHISRSKLAREIGVHTSTVSNWVDGKDVTAENLDAVCKYFGCSLDYLAGKTDEKENAPTSKGERTVTDNDIKFALFGGDGEITDAMFEEVKNFAAFVKAREEGKKE